MSETKARCPIEGEVWQSGRGSIRTVAHVEDDPDPHWVMYRRPPPATEEYATVSMRQWHDWVSHHNAMCIKKASTI